MGFIEYKKDVMQKDSVRDLTKRGNAMYVLSDSNVRIIEQHIRLFCKGDLMDSRWIKIIGDTKGKFNDTTGYRLFEEWYTKNQTMDEACLNIPISKSMFMAWRKRIVTSAAIQALKAGLIDL